MPRLTDKQREEMQGFILKSISDNAPDLIERITEAFPVTRQTAHRHVSRLVEEGLLVASGQTKARKYGLAVLDSFKVTRDVTPDLEEHLVWRQAEKILSHVPDNVRDICQHGFTEMLNNVVSHSGSQLVAILVAQTAVDVCISIADHGIGIFRKIQQDFDLPDPRQALVELAKGKLTSDSEHHTGEGIFFTSRMFDKFMIVSGELEFCRLNKNDDWLLEVEDRPEAPGTRVWMRISLDATQTDKEIFLRYVPEAADFGFTRTHVPIQLAVYEGEKLISRSQARRLLARVDKFAEVLLDFRGVAGIGQPFADEIFRVFQNRHPGTELVCINASDDVRQMISHVRATEAFGQKALFEQSSLEDPPNGKA
jgi:anti-sigma regulatory factor (Ser/Thr protein kinase)